MNITWKDKKTLFLGRNGTFKCTGVIVSEIMYLPKDKSASAFNGVAIEPLTSLGKIGRCAIDIPIESIPELIENLKQFIK